MRIVVLQGVDANAATSPNATDSFVVPTAGM
jgi:hypothetical protein